MTLTDAIIIALIGAISAVLTTIASSTMQAWKWRNGERQKLATDAAQSITDASLRLVEPLKNQVETMEARLAEMQEEINDLRQYNEALRAEQAALREWADRLVLQVRSLGHEPVKIRPLFVNAE